MNVHLHLTGFCFEMTGKHPPIQLPKLSLSITQGNQNQKARRRFSPERLPLCANPTCTHGGGGNGSTQRQHTHKSTQKGLLELGMAARPSCGEAIAAANQCFYLQWSVAECILQYLTQYSEVSQTARYDKIMMNTKASCFSKNSTKTNGKHTSSIQM